ncbi:MAG: thioredoxin family protein [Dehalococcoidia bacterium]
MKTKASTVLAFLVLMLVIVGACSGGDGSEDALPIATEMGPDSFLTATNPGSSAGSLDLASISLVDRLASGKPTLAEFGRGTCIPCKKMKPILEDLATEYDGHINVVIVEIQNHADLTRQYGIMAIPTQIFFDATGKEVDRHIGFYAKDKIVSKLEQLGLLQDG